MNYQTIKFSYTSPTKGDIVELFNFSDNTQTIITSQKTISYDHHDPVTVAFYITELLRELGRREVEYNQTDEKKYCNIHAQSHPSCK